MKRRPSLFSLALSLLSASAVAADAGPVLRVGSEHVGAAAVARAFARVPAFQLAALGTTDAARKTAVLEKLLVPELQAAAEARARGLDKRPRVEDRLKQLYARAMEAELARLTAAEQPVTQQDIERYFEQHKDRFVTPRRIRIWRIVVKDEALAKKIIAESQGAGGPQRWGNLAREHSLDDATKLRDGDLGFVRPDGSTDTPRVRVDPALFAAVEKLADGQLAPEPIQASGGIAVVWRRGSLPPIERTVADEAQAIRTLLTRERLEAARQKLVQELRKKSVSALDAQLLETLPDAMFAPAEPAARPLPPLPAPAPAPAGSEPPKPGERGTR